jgi:hypothetical protein
MNQAIPGILAAAGIAMFSTFFGAAVARIGWSQDLRQAQALRRMWDGTEKSLRERIKAQSEIIEIQKRRLGE